MKYQYKARNQAGVLQEGIVEASTVSNASNLLQRHNLVVVSLEAKKESLSISSLSRLWEGVSGKEFVIFSRQMAVMVEAKVPLLAALKGIIEQTDNPFFAKILSLVMADVDEGKSLSDAMRRHPDVFSELYVNMVQSGEISGNLQQSLESLADNIEKNYLLSQKIKGVLYYPAFILTAFFIVGFLMITFVIPKLTEMLKEETGVTLPVTTRILIWTGDFMQNYWWAVLIAIIAGVSGIVYYVRTDDGKKEFDVIKLKIPLVGRVFKFVYLARFSENLSTLVRSGIPIVSALQITARVVGNIVYERHINEAAEKVKTGGSMSEVLSQKKEFPSIMTQMVKVGEDTGKLDTTLDTMAKFFSREADQIVSNLSSIIEPVLIVILGVGVGTLVFSIIMPIYNIAQGIK
ncbi:MAG TPA: type II secretion system F family protein [Candidatus Bathyarchaeia archaeon]|nr:type II secretion system F family protein [Candidatus Bathyarchaeia archaeon]